MKQPVDLARRFLVLADRDIKTVRQLAGIPESDDEAIGFHAQQAIEKCLKAVLALHEVPFRKTHDLAELVDLLRDQGSHSRPTRMSWML
jgi:HEPN domain-containing protein